RPPPPSPTRFPYTTLFRSARLQTLGAELPVASVVVGDPGGEDGGGLALHPGERDPDAGGGDTRRGVQDVGGDVGGHASSFSSRRDRKSTRLNSSHVKISYA